MTTTTTVNYEGMSIEFKVIAAHLFSGSSSADMTGLDVHASAEKYDSILLQKMQARFPGAEIESSVLYGIEGDIDTFYCSACVMAGDDAPTVEAEAKDAFDALSSDVFDNYAGWAVESTTTTEGAV